MYFFFTSERAAAILTLSYTSTLKLTITKIVFLRNAYVAVGLLFTDDRSAPTFVFSSLRTENVGNVIRISVWARKKGS